MDTDPDLETRFRNDLVVALNVFQEEFSFSQFVAESPVSRKTADLIAAKLLASMFILAVDDRIITEKEKANLKKVARLLEISPSKQKEILSRAGKAKYRSELAAAKADGVITKEEQADLQKLLRVLVGPRKTAPKGGSKQGNSPSAPKGRPAVAKAPAKRVSANSVPPVPVPTKATSTSTLDRSQLRRSLCYQAQGTADSVLADMAALRQLDKKSENHSRSGIIVLVIGLGIIAVGVVIYLSDPLSRGISPTKSTGLVVGGIGLVTGVIGGVFSGWYSKMNLNDRQYEIVSGLVRLLSKDMADDAMLTVKIDFRPHNHRSKFQRKGYAGHWNVDYFVSRWLEVSGGFVDGTKYSIAMIEKHQDRNRTKRSASGKTKHKYKTKISSEAIVRLKIKQERYPKAQNLYGRIQKAVKLPPWVRLKSVTANGDQLVMRTTTSSEWNAVQPGERRPSIDGVNWMAMKFLSMYRLLNAAK